MLVERVIKTIAEKRVEFYLIIYKNKSDAKLLCSIIGIDAFLMKTAKDLIVWNARKNIRALAEEGFELLENEGQYFLKYANDIVDLGDLKAAAKELNAIFDKGTNAKAKTALEEWIERVKLRQQAYGEFVEKLGKEFIEGFEEHLNGVVGKSKTGKTKCIGIHNSEQILKGNVRLQGNKPTIPPIPKMDEPYLAFVQKYDEVSKMWINKTNSTLRLNGKQERSLTTMFPINWDGKRIMEEVAVAWKEMMFVEKFIAKENDKDVLVEKYLGKATTGMNIELIFNDGVLITSAPKIKI